MVEIFSPSAMVFQGQHKDETFEFYFRQHWLRLALPLIKLLFWNALIFSAGFVMFFGVSIEEDASRRLMIFFLSTFFVLTQVEFLSKFYRYFLYIIVVTDKKIHRIKKTLLTFDDHQSIDLWMLQDIQKHQHGILQNLLGFGTLIFEAQETVLRIHWVPRIIKKYERLMHLREQARSEMNYASLRKKMSEKARESVLMR